MAKWRKNESLGRALGREAGGIAAGVGKELLSIATLGFYRPKRGAHEITIKYPNGKTVKIKR
jgi:hypothetical protein